MIHALDSIGFPWKVRRIKGWDERHVALGPDLFQVNSPAQVLWLTRVTPLASIVLPRARVRLDDGILSRHSVAGLQGSYY